MLDQETIMKPTSTIASRRSSERGAALVMALMVTFLLLVGVTGLLLESSKNTQNITDTTAEQQAYNAAESGLQSAINVLRFKCTQAVSPCDVAPSPLLNSGLTDYNKANSINYSRALTPATSNVPGESSLPPRLSRWIAYDPVATDRVKLGPPGTPYSPVTGNAFSLELADPDNTGSNITFSTSGMLFDHDATDAAKRTYGTGANRVEIKYTPAAVTSLSVNGASPAATNFGTFTYTRFGTGAPIPALNRFEIVINMSTPVLASRVIRGFIQMNAFPYVDPPKIIFDSQTYDIRGSDIALNIPGAVMRQTGAQPYGYEGTMAVSGQPLNVAGTFSASPPARLLIKSTGYGPRGARKQLEAIIQNNYFNGLGAPATITLVGPPSTTNPATTFLFAPGNSNAMLYSGQDAAGGSTDIIPPIGVTGNIDPITGDDLNLDAVVAAVGGKLTDNVIGVPSNVTNEMPSLAAIAGGDGRCSAGLVQRGP